MASKIAETPAKVPPRTRKEDSRQCICSPTEHPGSFRCRLHRAGGVPRSIFCQQFGDPCTQSSPLLCSGRMPRPASQQQFELPFGSVMPRTASEQQLLLSAGVPGSIGVVEDFPHKK